MSAGPARWFWLAWSLLTVWLLACALLVQGEYGDGYQTIVNSRYLFGGAPEYYVQRGPLAAVALWPVEVLVAALAVDPLDVRPYHFFSAALHSAYLVGCWLLLRRVPGSAGARLAAFAAAILCVPFYAYAPFLSHDLLPGLLLLLMLFLCHRWLEHGRAGDAAWLVVIGAAVVLVKQTYAVFWIAICLYAVTGWALGIDRRRITAAKAATLLGLAAASAAITWLGYGLFIGPQLPEAPLLLRPTTLIGAIAGQYADPLQGLFVPDLYLRNLHNFGLAAVLLVVPALWLALRGDDARQRLLAVCWIVIVLIMQWVSFKEVRYLAFLAPVTAALILPAASRLLTRRAAAALLIAVLALDQLRGLATASKPLTTASSTDVTRFLNSPADGGRVFMSRTLSFAYHAASPLLRDRYHGIYHLTPDLFYRLHRGRVPVTGLVNSGRLGAVGIAPGDTVYFANSTLVRSAPWQDDRLPTDLGGFLLVAGNAEELQLQRTADGYEANNPDGDYLMYLPDAGVGEQLPAIGSGTLPFATATRLYGERGSEPLLSVLGVRVTALCRADVCSYRAADN